MPGPDVPGPDLLSGAGGWRNIQAVIRSAIASLAHRMEACERDGAALRDAMGDAPRFADLHQAVSQRASTEDLETMGLGLQDQLSRRADALAERLAASQRDNHRLQERVASLEARIEACERRSAAAEEALAAKAEVSSLAGLVTAAELDAAGLLSRRDVEAMLASRVTRQELSDVADGLATRRDAEETRRLCEERPGRTEGPLVGRWVWKSRELREGGLVPWEHEAENTDEEALVWEGSGSTRVVAARPGLYRCCVGMFSGRAPVVTILVDGSPVVTCAPGAAADASKRLGASGRGAGSPGRSRLGASTASVTAAMAAAAAAAGAPQSGVTLHRHPVGSVAGLSLVQFLALPQRAAVSVMFEGEVRGQGFLELKKL
ncbi:hypothetical protein FNF27_01468 [Cafeteria roenbergensis]|uniref:Uncharacterized protein n=1 Tax=Cafeteria roenbergensis TaxID=33653 RepID=A0A5A8EIV3_CAFRO|nr:hypothetical protein FNF27_01468 [Cafeteria roenbergensis]